MLETRQPDDGDTHDLYITMDFKAKLILQNPF